MPKKPAKALQVGDKVKREDTGDVLKLTHVGQRMITGTLLLCGRGASNGRTSTPRKSLKFYDERFHRLLPCVHRPAGSQRLRVGSPTRRPASSHRHPARLV